MEKVVGQAVEQFPGVLFQNTSEAETSSRPEYVGKCTIAGVQYSLRGYSRIDKMGKPFIKLKVKKEDTKGNEKVSKLKSLIEFFK